MSCSSVSISSREARSRFQEADSWFALYGAASQPDTQLQLVMFLESSWPNVSIDLRGGRLFDSPPPALRRSLGRVVRLPDSAYVIRCRSFSRFRSSYRGALGTNHSRLFLGLFVFISTESVLIGMRNCFRLATIVLSCSPFLTVAFALTANAH